MLTKRKVASLATTASTSTYICTRIRSCNFTCSNVANSGSVNTVLLFSAQSMIQANWGAESINSKSCLISWTPMIQTMLWILKSLLTTLTGLHWHLKHLPDPNHCPWEMFRKVWNLRFPLTPKKLLRLKITSESILPNIPLKKRTLTWWVLCTLIVYMSEAIKRL